MSISPSRRAVRPILFWVLVSMYVAEAHMEAALPQRPLFLRSGEGARAPFFKESLKAPQHPLSRTVEAAPRTDSRTGSERAVELLQSTDVHNVGKSVSSSGRGPGDAPTFGHQGVGHVAMSKVVRAGRSLLQMKHHIWHGNPRSHAVEYSSGHDTLYGLPKFMWVIVADVLAMLAFLGCIPVVLGMAKRKKQQLQ